MEKNKIWLLWSAQKGELVMGGTFLSKEEAEEHGVKLVKHYPEEVFVVLEARQVSKIFSVPTVIPIEEK